MSIGHHGPTHDLLSSIGGSISFDNDLPQSSIVSCLVSTSVAVAAR